MAEPRSTAQEASDPSTSPERLLELTEKHPQLHRLIVLNPSCPEVARQWILATNPWAKQAFEQSLATSPDAAPEDIPEDAPDTSPEEDDPDGVSVWGDLGTSTTAATGTDTAPQERPSETPTASVRIAENAGVVPLGASPATAASPPSAVPAPLPADQRTAAPAYGEAPAYVYGAAPIDDAAAGPAAGVAAGTAAPDQDDGSRTRRRAWYACGGCLLLALLLVLVMALVGRAWLAGDEEEYQRDSSTTAAEESPSEQPTEEPTEEETTPDPVSPAPEDAREMTELRSPTGNISCLLEKDSVSCSVLEHDYSGNAAEGCEDAPFSIQIGEGEATRACGSTFLSEEGTTLEYDDSAAYGDMACTSRLDGMTCWNTLTGKGFMVNRSTYETF